MAASTVLQARGAKVLQRTDSFSGSTLYFTPPENPKLEGGSFLSERYVLLDLEADKPVTDPNFPYEIKVDATLPDWMFIQSGGSLHLKIDGKMITLSGTGSADDRTVLDGDSVEEVAYYNVSPAVLQQIGQAQDIQFRIYGDNNVITGTFTPKILADMQLFASAVPKMIGLKPAAADGNVTSVASAAPTVPAAAATSTSPAAAAPATAAERTPVASAAAAPAAASQPAVRKPLGVSFVKVPWLMRHSLHVAKGMGVWVLVVKAGSPAAAAGLTVGDVIMSFDGHAVHSPDDLKQFVAQHVPGKPAPFEVRRNGQDMKLTAPL